MASLEGLDHIGEKIFKFHQGKDVLNFRLVCKSWQEILENPMYWLKQLKKIGQSKKAHSDTLVLIRKTSKAGIPLTKIGYCLLIKYMKITSTNLPQNKQKSCRAFFFRLPMLYIALISGKPDLELVGFLVKLNPRIAKPIKCLPEFIYIRGKFTLGYQKEIDPLSDAIAGEQTLEVIRILISEFKDQIDFSDRLIESVDRQNFELVKEFGDKLDDKTEFFVNHASYPSPMFHAIRLGNVEILKYLVSRNKGLYKTNKPFYKTTQPYSATPLHDIFHNCGRNLKTHHCIEMANLVFPKIEDINAINVHGQTLFDEIISKFENWVHKKCIIHILKLIVPFSNIIEENAKSYPPPIYELVKSFQMNKTEEGFEVVVSKKKAKIEIRIFKNK